jgi:hypothetical protein
MNRESSNNSSGRFLLSGASGMLGTALRDALARRQAQIVQLVRFPPMNPNEVQWEPSSPVPIANPQALDKLEAAIHLSGANLAARRWTPDYRREIMASRVDSTRALAETLAALRQPPRTLLVSSAVGIYGDRGDEILDEGSPPGSGFLPEVCRAWEQAAQPAVAAGIRVVHLRFGVVLSADSGALAQMLPLFRLGLGGKLGSGKQWMSWIALPDLVAAVMFALESAQLSGPLNITSPQPVTNAGFTAALARQLQRPAPLPVPAFALRLVLGPMADEALLTSTRAVPRKLLDAGLKFTQPGLEEALAEAVAAR